jgi:hypothetical protein
MRQASIEARRPTQVPVYSPLISLIPATADSPPGEKPSAHPSLAGTGFGPYPWEVGPCPLGRVCRPAASASSANADANALLETAAVAHARGRTACRGQFLGQGRRARPAQRRNLPAMAAALLPRQGRSSLRPGPETCLRSPAPREVAFPHPACPGGSLPGSYQRPAPASFPHPACPGGLLPHRYTWLCIEIDLFAILFFHWTGVF